MDDEGDPQTLNLFAGRRTNGSVVSEEVLVEPLGGGRYRARATPGLVAGLAAGDEFQIGDDQSPTALKILKRGGNIGIQFFAPAGELPRCEAFLREGLAPLGGRLDGKQRLLLVWTVPVRAGFPAIERVLRAAEGAFPGSEWMYSNVYADDGVTPLNWW